MQYSVTQHKSCFISAGHSMTDPGAVSDGLTEAEVVLDLRDRLYRYLLVRGAMVSRDGKGGQNLPLSKAIPMARAVDLAIELHCNAAGNPRATGVETLQNPEHRPFGRKICDALAEAMQIRNRGPKGESSGQHSRLGFISKGGGIIVELFFLSNPDDRDAYFSNKEKVVKALGDCILREITSEY